LSSKRTASLLLLVGLLVAGTIAVPAHAQSVVLAPAQNTAFGGVNVCPFGQTAPAPCSQTITLTYNVTSSVTFGATTVVTQGKPNLDFTQGSGSTCTGAVSSGNACTVNVTFAPIAPGLRLGAVQLTDSSGDLLATTMVYGLGQGPVIAFGPGTQTTVATGLNSPRGVAVDAAGDIFIADTVNNRVLEIPAHGSGPVPLPTSGLSSPTGLAVDGAGDVFIVDQGNNQVVEVSAYSGTQTTVISGLNTPQYVAVDGAANVFVSDYGSNQVVEIPSNGAAQITVGSDLKGPQGLAVDGAGDVFIADYGNNRVVKVSAGGGTETTVVSGLYAEGVAVDAAGDVFITDTKNNRVVEIASAGGTQTLLGSGLKNVQGVAVDGAGNVFIADRLNNRVVKVNRSLPPALAFATTSTGSTSAPKSVIIQNIGNQLLNAVSPGLVVGGPNFLQVPGSGSPADCTTSFALAPGATCNLSISFEPQSSGPLTGKATFTDNALNATLSASQNVALKGTGKGTSAATLSSTKVQFAQQGVNTTSPSQSVLLNNTGSSPLTVAGITATGLNPTDFAATANGCSGVPSSSNCTISFTFTPSAVGTRSAAFAIASNASTLPSISVKGTGIDGPAILLSPNPPKFPSEPAGQQSGPEPITLTSTGTAPLTLNSLVVSGAQAADFAETDNCGAPTTLAVGAYCTITITFTPASVGNRSAILTVSDNASPSKQTVALSGKGLQGTGPQITVQLNASSLYTLSTGSGTVQIQSPAPAGGQQIFLSSNNTNLFASPGLPTSVTIPAGQTSTNFNFSTSALAGACVITGFAENFQNGTATLNVANRTMTLMLSAAVVGSGRNLIATLKLGQPAPVGGTTINFSSQDPTIAVISPTNISIAAGATSSTTPVSVTGIQAGATGVSAQAVSTGTQPSGFTGATASVAVSSQLLTLGKNLVLAPGQTLPLPITLSDNGSPISVSLSSSPSGIVTFPADPVLNNAAQITGAKPGTATVTVNDPSGKYASDTTTVTVSYALNFSPSTTLNVIDFNTATVQLNLSYPSPASGFTATLSTADPTIATVPASVHFGSGVASVSVTVKGVAVGSTTLTATGVGANTVSIPLSVGPAATIALSPVTVGKDLEVISGGTLSEAAPAGNLQVVLTSSDPGVVLSPDGVTPGAKSITVQVPAGSTTLPSFSVIGLTNSGTPTLSATAIGYAPASATLTLVPSGFVISSTSIQTAVGLPDSGVTIVPAQLDPTTFAVVASPVPVRAGGNFRVAVTSSTPAVGSILTTPLIFTGGVSSAATTFHPLTTGSTNISVVEPAGFSQPASQTQISASVNSAGFVGGSSVAVGNNLQLGYNLGLTQPVPAGNLQVTATSSDPVHLLLSGSTSTAGSGTLTVQADAGATSAPTIYLQAFAGSGSATVTVQAAGYLNYSFTVTFVPSGFVVLGTGCPAQTSVSTTTLAAASPLYVVVEPLDPTTFQPNLVNSNCAINEPLAPGITPLSVNVSSDTPTVGTVTTGTLTFNGGDGEQSTGFVPTAAGSANVIVATPAGYTAPASDQQLPVTVVPAGMYLSSVTTGLDLQSTISLSLATAAPPGNETIMLTSADPTKLLLSSDPTVLGTQTLGVIVYAQTGSPSSTIYAQALQGSGSVNVTATAPDFGTVTTTVPLVPSGFVLFAPYCASAFSITPYSSDQSLQVFSVPLDPNTQAAPGCYYYYPPSQPLIPGVGPVSVTLTSSDAGVGSIDTNPVVFNTGDSTQSTAFHPVSTGTSTLSLNPTPGFTTPSNYQPVVATVSNGAISLSTPTVGAQLEAPVGVSLGVASPSGTAITVTSGDPSTVLLSTDPTVAGSASVQITVLPGSGSSTTPVYAQALKGSGSVTLTATAAGYDSATSLVNLVPSGFVMSVNAVCYGTSSFSITSLSGAESLLIIPVPLDPSTLNYTGFNCYGYNAQAIAPGFGPVTIAVTNSNGGAGTITATPLTFNVGDSVQTTSFQPANVGSSTIGLGALSVTGFSTPSNFQQVAATVTNPAISLYAANVGANLQTPISVSLSVAAPAAGEVVTLTSSDSTKIVLSTDPTVAGSGSLQLSIPSGSYGPAVTIYEQAIAGAGSATLTASGPSFDPSSTTVSVMPSGFILTAPGCQTSVSTSLLSGNTSLNVGVTPLDPTTLNASVNGYYYNCPPAIPQTLIPGLGSVNVSVNSSATTVGTVIASPLTFQTGNGSLGTGFAPASNGNSNVTITSPAGFSTPSNYQQVAFSVVPASIYANNINVGRFMETSTSISLGAPAPGAGVTVTITSSDPTKVQFSTDPTILGAGSLSFSLSAGQSSTPTFYVQAKCMQGGSSCTGSNGVGSVPYTIQASGYATAQSSVSVLPSGFALQGIGNSISTTTSSDTSLQVTPVALDPTYLTIVDYETLVPGVGQTSVSVLTSTSCGGTLDQTVGAITVSPVIFMGADVPNYQSTSFHPIAPGSDVIYIPAPAGFSRASNGNCVTANVTQ